MMTFQELMNYYQDLDLNKFSSLLGGRPYVPEGLRRIRAQQEAERNRPKAPDYPQGWLEYRDAARALQAGMPAPAAPVEGFSSARTTPWGAVVHDVLPDTATPTPTRFVQMPSPGYGAASQLSSVEYTAPSNPVPPGTTRYSVPGTKTQAEVPTKDILPSYQLGASSPEEAVKRARDIEIEKRARETYDRPSNPAPANSIVRAGGYYPNRKAVSQQTMDSWAPTFRQTDQGRMSVPEAAKMRDEQVASGQMSSYQRPDGTTWYSTKRK